MESQTRVLEEQLGAQVWPYVGESLTVGGNTVKIAIENDGLGPAILRGISIDVDGVSRRGYVEFLHAILGPNIVGRTKHGEKMSLDVSGVTAGSVVRAGESVDLLTFGSKRYAQTLLRAYSRIEFRACYCAVIPGKCWIGRSSVPDPEPVAACPTDPHDVLHASATDALLNKRF